MIIHNGSYIWFHTGQTARWGTINAIKALPYLMIAYQIDGQWYSDPDFLPPKNLEVKPTIPISSAIIHIPKTTVELQPLVQLCAGFRNRKIHSLWVVNAPEQVLKHILECKQWDSISPKQLLETLYELILYGYEVKILPAKKETISPIEWMDGIVMTNSNQQLTLYYPCVVQILDRFVQTISVEFWIQNPINDKWNLVVLKDGDSSSISGYTYATAPRKMAYLNEEYLSIEAFLQAKKEEGVDYPIRHKRTYLTVKGAASHKLFWTWTNPQTNKIERIHWHPLAIKVKASEDDRTDYSNITPVKIVNGKLITLEKENLPSNRAAFSEFLADREENLRLALEALKSPNPDAALELLAIMEEISKDCFYASWIMGNGYNLASILKSWDGTSNVSYGGGEITQQQLALMRVLSELSQGWWFWDEDQDTGVIFQS